MTPRILTNVKLSGLTLDPAAQPGPGCTPPHLVNDWPDMIGATITKVTGRGGLTVTMRMPGDPGPDLGRPVMAPISFGFQRHGTDEAAS
jgi:hypothetical protein